MLTPTSIRKLLYNPAPLNKFIAKACLMAWEKKAGSRDPRKWTGSLSQTRPEPEPDRPLCGREFDPRHRKNSGRDALLNLEEILRSRALITPQPSHGKDSWSPMS